MNGFARRTVADAMPPQHARAVPWVSVMVASTLTVLPVVATVPLLPPPGLTVLLAWRLLARFALRPWAAAPLGLWDDLLSGQPMGSAVLLWSLCFLAIELAENGMPFRSVWQEWLMAAAALTFCLVAGRAIALPHVPVAWPLMAAQVAVSVLTFPLAARLVAWVDRRRGMPA